jgi:hypothetical protein
VTAACPEGPESSAGTAASLRLIPTDRVVEAARRTTASRSWRNCERRARGSRLQIADPPLAEWVYSLRREMMVRSPLYGIRDGVRSPRRSRRPAPRLLSQGIRFAGFVADIPQIAAAQR